MNSQFWIANLSEWIGVIAVTMLLSVSPRIKLKKVPLIFKYPKREMTVSLSLFIPILIYAYISFSGFVPPLRISFGEGLGDLWEHMFVAVVCMIPFIAALIMRKQPLLSVGWKRAMMGAGFQMGLALAVITLFLRNRFLAVLDGLSPYEINAFWMWLVIAFAEESVFRGYIQSRLVGIWGRVAGIAAVVALFTLWNLPRLMADSGETLVLNIFLTVVQGALAGYIYDRSGHVLAPLMYRAVAGWILFVV